MAERRFALMKIRAPLGHPNLREAAAILGVEESDLDKDFGVIAINPAQHGYAVKIDENAVASAITSDNVEGPFTNPPIGSFGPEESK